MTNEIFETSDVKDSLTDAPLLSFNFPGGEVGRIECKDGVLTFAGNADASAQVFIEHVIERYDVTLRRLRDALVHADLTIRSFPGADQSHVTFIRHVLDTTPAPQPNVAGLEAQLDAVWNAAVEQAAVIANDCVHLTPDPGAAIRVMLDGRAKLHQAASPSPETRAEE